MTDTEFLDALEFRVQLRRGDDCRLIDLNAADVERLFTLQGYGYWRTSVTQSFSKGSLLASIQHARERLIIRVTARITGGI